MTENWYTKGYNLLMDELTDIVADNNEPEQIAKAVYSFLNEVGLIDYDIEKEILFERYSTE